jgi:hypothetical protein
MKINDFLIPVFVLIILGFILFKFRKLRMNNNENFSWWGITRLLSGSRGSSYTPPASDNNSSSDSPPVTENTLGQNFDLSGQQINIEKNLFIGFSSKEESEANLTFLKNAKLQFQDKMNGINPGENSIIINNNNYSGDKIVNDICLGVDEGSDSIACLNSDSIEKFNYEKKKIPKFKDAGGRHVYYNADQPLVRHNKLCFYEPDSKKKLVKNFDENGSENKGEHCIMENHLNLINGNTAVKLKVQDGSKYKEISPVNVEFGPIPGFQNTAVRPFYMTDDDINPLNTKLGATETCYANSRKHSAHPAYTPYSAKASFILNPVPKPLQLYSHIHSHIDKNPNI